MNKNEMMAKMAKHIEDDLHNAARFIAGEVYDMLCTYEQTMIDKVLEIIDTAQTYKMFEGQEDTYIDKKVLREVVEALRGEQK